MENIRNFCIIAHIDSGKSTLADRFLELTGTVDKRQMKPQYLDKMELERERGITIKMAPVRMIYHANRGLTRMDTRINADKEKGLIYEELTYKIRGCFFKVYNALGPGQKESVYQNALELEFVKTGINFEKEKSVNVLYDGKNIGVYRPDFVVDSRVLIEIKSLPVIAALQKKQTWNYLKGSDFRLAFLVNFGGKKLEIERIVYDSARFNIRENPRLDPRESAQVEDYILNLIDTPGHSDFGYEVSRALAAVEGAILLVDGTKGIQAQTLFNLRGARGAGLKIIGAVNKVDLNLPNLDKTISSVAELLGVAPEEIFRVSAKTGEGVRELLDAVVQQVPPPRNYAERTQNNAEEKFPRESALAPSEIDGSSPRDSAQGAPRALIFDSFYDDHKGTLAFVRVFGPGESSFKASDEFSCVATGARFKPKEIGFFSPNFTAANEMRAGNIGYIATGLKEPEKIRVGDTITQIPNSKFQIPKTDLALPGYKEPTPVVFISFYPDGKTKFEDLKKGIERLRLSDPALSVELEANDALGRGLKIGFLGQLHFEIIASRLEREFNLEFLTSFPSVAYKVLAGNGADKRGLSAQINADKNIRENPRFDPRESAAVGTRVITQPQYFPDHPDRVWQPIIKLEILSPGEHLNSVAALKKIFDLEIIEVETLGDNIIIKAKMPLAELIRDFDDQLKSASSGYASFSYEVAGEEAANVVKLEILVVEEVVPALTRIVAEKDVEREGRHTVERLKELLPKQQFSQALQARAHGRIIARETIPAMKKLLGNFGKTGGDRTRKMKLWKKQKRGKEKLEGMAKVDISPETFREILKK